jgi:hypothetical protein
VKHIFIVTIMFLFLHGCSTGYQRSGLSGGYSETQLDANVFKVSFRGNGYTRREKAADLTLLRSAELTLTHGFKYFSIIDANSYTSYSTVSTPTTYHTTANVYGSGSYAYGTATTTSYGGHTYNISKPSTSNTIICFKEKPENSFSYSAEFIYRSIAQKYGIQQRHILSSRKPILSKPKLNAQEIKEFVFAFGDEIRKELEVGIADKAETLMSMLKIKSEDKDVAAKVLHKLAIQDKNDIDFAKTIVEFYSTN